MEPNSLTFIALCNEFCAKLESLCTGEIPERSEFVAAMLNYIPRIYISATDLRTLPAIDEADEFMVDSWAIESVLDEDYYEAVRRSIECVMGEDDVYLEVFEEDMKYSDTPISASIAEGLADMFQVLYNFIETVRDAPNERVRPALAAVKEDFEHYWSQTACNLMRAINNVRYHDND